VEADLATTVQPAIVISPELVINGRRRFAFRALRVMLGLALLVGTWACLPLISKQFANSVTNSVPTTTPFPSLPHAVPPNPTASTTSELAPTVTTLPTVPFTPPRIEFFCPHRGAGWSAKAVASEFRIDADGFNIWWYVDSLSEWIYWGTFRSGISTSWDSARELEPDTTFMIKLSRGDILNPPPDDDSIAYTTPAEAC
jgi:hypothetical protein